MVETILELVALFLLGGYLWKKHCARIDRQCRQLEELNWQAKGFDSAPLKPRLDAVRKDYTIALGGHHPGTASKPRLLSLARNLVCSLGYFRDRTPSETEHAAAPELRSSPGSAPCL